MTAPRLLEKKVVRAEVATERKQEIDKGKKLVDSILALQETKAREESELDLFRRETVAKVQIEINAKLAERDAIAADIPRLKAERLLAQAPINLKEEWLRVREDKQANVSWQDRNTQEAIGLLAREEDNRLLSGSLSKEKEEIEKEHKLSLRTLAEADAKFTQADQALERAEKEAQTILSTAQQRDNHLKVREEDATLREASLSKREEEVGAHELDLSNREQKLKSRQETFMRAQAYIKNKKKS